MDNMEPNVLPKVEWTQSYKANPNKISFLDLPKELRDCIYDLAFQVPGAILVVHRGYTFTTRQCLPIKGRVIRYKNRGPPEPQHLSIPTELFATCRQLHAEGTEALYGHNIFSFPMAIGHFATPYRSLFRHVVFSLEVGRGIYSHNIEEMGYSWRRLFYPNVVETSTKLLTWYPKLETLTLPIRSDRPGHIWQPTFMMAPHKTSEQRIAMGARWLKANCPMRDERLCSVLGFQERLDDVLNLEERLRQVLHLEVQVPHKNHLTREDFAGSTFAFEDVYEPEEWDHTEFARAFRQARGVGV